LGSGIIGTTASAQLFSTLPTLCSGAASYSGRYCSKMVLPPWPVYRDFQLVVPKGPGFGVTIDEEKLALYRRGRS
jgi:muconate cycloisomerase